MVESHNLALENGLLTVLYNPAKHSSEHIFANTIHLMELTLKVPITTGADDKFGDILPNFRKWWQTILMKYVLFVILQKQKNLKVSSAANSRWRVKEAKSEGLHFLPKNASETFQQMTNFSNLKVEFLPVNQHIP